MKRILLALAVAAGAAGIAVALQDDRAATNKTCPVRKGRAINPEILSVYEGKPIGFCCEKCKKLWDKDPSEYAANLATANEPPVKAPEPAQLGKPAPFFELKDTDGNAVALDDFKDRIVVLQWTDPACPASERLAAGGVTQRMILKLKSASDKLVHFTVCSAADMMPDKLAAFLADRKVESKGLLDGDGKIAKAYGAKTASHVFVIDGGGVLRYSGAIDNDPDGKKGDKAVNYGVAAVEAILKGKKANPESTKPYGAPIKGRK
jgi:peroxiredoxin/YHS domain-containing protein